MRATKVYDATSRAQLARLEIAELEPVASTNISYLNHVRQTAEAAPPLTDEQRGNLAGIVRTYERAGAPCLLTPPSSRPAMLEQ